MKEKILLLGDYSGFYLNLKKGFQKLGKDVTLVSLGDGWKKIEGSDIELNYSRNIILRLFDILKNNILLYKRLKKIKFDYIFIVNQGLMSSKFNLLYNSKLQLTLNQLLKLKKNESSKVYVSACGDDSYYFKAFNRYRYFPHSEKSMKTLPLKFRLMYLSENSINNYNNNLKKLNGVIPIAWDYAEAYRLFYKDKNKIVETIPLPIDISTIRYSENIIKNKVVIFHGLNREGFKGTEYIKEAMENIKKKYPDKVEIIIDGKMPLEEYKKVLEKSNIVIDQCKSYSYGMNALISMAQGKLVFSGNELECSKELGRDDIPVINILPEVRDIEEKLEYYIKNPELISEMGKKSRHFVEKFHECSIVAKKYLDIINN